MSGHTGNEKLVNRCLRLSLQFFHFFRRAMDSEYEALMSELGGGKKGGALSQNRGGFSTQNYHGTASIQRVSNQLPPLILNEIRY